MRVLKQVNTASWFDPVPCVLVRHDDGTFEVIDAVCHIEDRDLTLADMVWDLQHGAPEPARFKSAKAALRHERVNSYYLTTGDDLDAFHAPSECAPIAYAACDRYAERWDSYLSNALVNKNAYRY